MSVNQLSYDDMDKASWGLSSHLPVVQGAVYDALTSPTTTLMFESGWGTLQTFTATYFWAGWEALKIWVYNLNIWYLNQYH